MDPTTLFHSDIDEATQRVLISTTTLKQFSQAFNYYKENISRFFKSGQPPKLWTFHPNTVFERYNIFLDRLSTIQWFFNTVLEFTKLEKVEVGGIKGRVLSGKVTGVSAEFQRCFSAFSGNAHGLLDPDDDSFIEEFENFKHKIVELDLKLAAILCQAIEECTNLDSMFKVGIHLQFVKANNWVL